MSDTITEIKQIIEELEKIENDPVLTVQDVVEFRREST